MYPVLPFLLIMETLIKLDGGTAKGYSINAGAINIIFATTGKGMIACGAFNVAALEKFGYPAVRMQSPIRTIDELLGASAAQVNQYAAALGIDEQMTGRQCLELML